jgi:hypothetical protein
VESLPSEFVIVGVIGLVLLGLVLLVKFGKQILTALLVIIGLVIMVVVAWALLQRPEISSKTGDTISDLADIARAVAPKSEPAARVYQAPAPSGGGNFVAGVLTALMIVALCAGGYCWARWKLAERGTPGNRRRRKPTQSGAPVVYIVERETDDDEGLTLEEWEEWPDGDLFQF